ncbi:hypothetical protein MC885_018675 [Smutsia gigantea]|nr:hypothetical protein MC885_018675 [Smutsia gigantea]
MGKPSCPCMCTWPHSPASPVARVGLRQVCPGRWPVGRSGRSTGPLLQGQAGHKGGSHGPEQADSGTMGTQRDSHSWGAWALLFLLLGLTVPPATAEALSYREAVLHAVDGFNQRSSEPNLYRLLQLDPLPKDAEDQGAVKPVSFTVKETVCPRTSQQPPEQCDFKENGLVKQCLGTIILDREEGYFDISCDEPLRTKRFGNLGGLLQKGGQKIGQKIERLGQKIKDFFSNLEPREET